MVCFVYRLNASNMKESDTRWHLSAISSIPSITSFISNNSFVFDISVRSLIELVVDEVYKLNEIIRSLNTNTANAIELAQETQTIEREIDIKYRQATIKLLTEISNTKELLLMKDVIEGIEEMADKCQRVSDSFILLALSL